MANKQLFSSSRGALAPAAMARNDERAPAYAHSDRHCLAQYAVTGCLNGTFYANGAEQLEAVLALSRNLDARFIAQTAVYAREKAAMKDMPALLLAVLSLKSPVLLKQVFARVIDNGKMLRTFVQILRSGAVGRKSLGSAPKTLVQNWLNTASERQLIDAIVGADPSLGDVVRMVHPKPADKAREALYGWLLGKPYALEALPEKLQRLALYRFDRSQPVPEVPFQMLTSLGLNREEWAQVARRGGWHMVRMNLNTFARHGVYEVPEMTQVIAAKLCDRIAIRKARVFPYQLLAAYYAAGPAVPDEVRAALEAAMEIALENIGPFTGRVVVCPDVSGSMASPVTGVRRGASTTVRCVDVAALMTAAILRVNREATVLPFDERVRNLPLDAKDSVLTNARLLAGVGGGGTNCSAPLQRLNAQRHPADLVILVSDNQSWVDARAAGPTETMRQWQAFKRWNPAARLVCIDVQPNATTQALEQPDVLNIGGFSDAVFEVIGAFAAGQLSGGHWVERIEAVEI